MNSSSLAMPDNPDRRALQAGIELADEGVLLLDGKSRIIVGNGLARELMRVASPRIEGIDFWDLLADQTIQKHLNATHRALKAAKTYTFTEHDPFEKRWIEYRVSSRPLGIVVTVREVTDRHQLLSVLRESEQRNSGLFEVNPNIMWVFDLDSLKVLAANHASWRSMAMSGRHSWPCTWVRSMPRVSRRNSKGGSEGARPVCRKTPPCSASTGTGVGAACWWR